MSTHSPLRPVELDLRGLGRLALAMGLCGFIFVAIGVRLANVWSTVWGLLAGICLVAAGIALGVGLRHPDED